MPRVYLILEGFGSRAEVNVSVAQKRSQFSSQTERQLGVRSRRRTQLSTTILGSLRGGV
jgi:hypothetical protein